MENERLMEIERKIDDLFKEMEFHELIREPYDISKRIGNLKRILEESYTMPPQQLLESSIEKIIGGYFLDMGEKTKDREKLSEKLLSDFLKKETGFSEQDIEMIKEPFHLFTEKSDIFNFLKKYNFEPFLTYKNKLIPFENFKYRFQMNKCPILSNLYSLSTDNIVQIITAQEATYESKKSIELVLRDIKGEYNLLAYNDDPEIKQLNKIIEIEEKQLDKFIKKGKEFLAKNIVELESIYKEIRKSYKSIAEYFEKDMLEARY